MDESFDSPDVREAINGTLREILCSDNWGQSTWDALIKNLREEFGIETDLLELAQTAPCLLEMFQVAALAKKGILRKESRKTLTEIVHKLIRIAFHAENGHERSSNQLKVLHKIAYPASYELPASIIKNLADSYHTSPHLARAWSVRDLMLDLAFIVEPTRIDRSVLDGPVKLAKWDLDFAGSKLHEKAARHIKRGTTLQSLAIAIYVEDLENEGIRLEPRELKRDLQKLKEWEAINLTDPSDRIPLWNPAGYPSASLPMIPIYSEGWKQQWRRGDKDRGKLS
jgi:hypothetical protein